MNMEQYWSDTDRGKPKFSEKNLSQWYFVYHKSDIGWSGIFFFFIQIHYTAKGQVFTDNYCNKAWI
jgi:hypothetical protein